MSTSGQLREIRPTYTFCDKCTYEGQVDLDVDWEDHSTYWKCRECWAEHEGSTADLEPCS